MSQNTDLSEEEYNSLCAKFRCEWLRAEGVLKKVERIKNSVFMPSINELRYAGRRFVQAQNGVIGNGVYGDSVHIDLIEAIENCRKARHDAIDSTIYFIHERIETISSLVGLKEVKKNAPNFPEIWDQIVAIDKLIIKSRKERTSLDACYEEIKDKHLDVIVDLYIGFKKSGLEITAEHKKARRAMISTFAITVFGSLIVGIFASLIASKLYAWLDKILI